jgi:hypothetical protein
MNFHEFMCSYEDKIIKNANSLFQQQFLMCLHAVLCKINIIESSYRIIIIRTYIILGVFK